MIYLRRYLPIQIQSLRSELTGCSCFLTSRPIKVSLSISKQSKLKQTGRILILFITASSCEVGSHPQLTSQSWQHRAGGGCRGAPHNTYLFILPMWWIARCGGRRVNCRAGTNLREVWSFTITEKTPNTMVSRHTWYRLANRKIIRDSRVG